MVKGGDDIGKIPGVGKPKSFINGWSWHGIVVKGVVRYKIYLFPHWRCHISRWRLACQM